MKMDIWFIHWEDHLVLAQVYKCPSAAKPWHSLVSHSVLWSLYDPFFSLNYSSTAIMLPSILLESAKWRQYFDARRNFTSNIKSNPFIMLNFSQMQFIKMFIPSMQKEKELWPTFLLGHLVEERKKLEIGRVLFAKWVDFLILEIHIKAHLHLYCWEWVVLVKSRQYLAIKSPFLGHC